ncbi:mucin-7-like [Fukomys damarensis]|uniref:mucin-7-like n=1 Tax=Fukomys damarensis TaxID=885580 RepID=UPI00053F42F2|nr:mucin-7-like [Fukomys damarensis]
MEQLMTELQHLLLPPQPGRRLAGAGGREARVRGLPFPGLRVQGWGVHPALGRSPGPGACTGARYPERHPQGQLFRASPQPPEIVLLFSFFPDVFTSQPAAESSSATPTSSSPSDPSSSSPGDSSTARPSAPSTGEITTSPLSSTPTDAGAVSPSPHSTTDAPSGSESPGSAFTPLSQSASLPSSPLPGPGDTMTPTSHRNPGVVVAVCLVLSLLLIGAVVLAVRRCHRDTSEFLTLDQVSMASVS